MFQPNLFMLVSANVLPISNHEGVMAIELLTLERVQRASKREHELLLHHVERGAEANVVHNYAIVVHAVRTAGGDTLSWGGVGRLVADRPNQNNVLLK